MLGEVGVLVERKIQFFESWPAQAIAAHVAEMAASGQAVAVAGRRQCGGRRVRVRVSQRGSVAECTGYLKGGQVNAVSAASIADWTNYVGSVKTLPRTGVVALKVVIQLEGLTVLKVQDAVHSPAIFQLRRTPAKLGKGVTKVPGQAAADIEVRISPLQAGEKAVIRLGSVGNEILEVAGIIDGMRPDEVEGRVKSAPAVDPHAGL